ncbi:MAG: hypothetical protein ACRDRL_32700, partial [Sciscionella sp.]
PLHSAVAGGATHVLVLRTRRVDERTCPPAPIESAVVARYLRRFAPAAVAAWLGRTAALERDRALLAAGRLGGSVLAEVSVPAGSPPVGRLERDGAVLRRAVLIGRHAMSTRMDSGRFLDIATGGQRTTP